MFYEDYWIVPAVFPAIATCQIGLRPSWLASGLLSASALSVCEAMASRLKTLRAGLVLRGMTGADAREALNKSQNLPSGAKARLILRPFRHDSRRALSKIGDRIGGSLGVL